MRSRRLVSAAALLVLATLSLSCATTSRRVRSNALEYLYPNGAPAVPARDVRLQLPVRVGIAFVPESGMSYGGDALDEVGKRALLERVAAAFRNREGIASVEPIPSSYLAAGGGFEELDRIRASFGIDLAALVSYDQLQFSDSGNASLLYWTVVGAYVVKGERNETRTVVDTIVYDLPSRAMLFRASGQSSIGGRSTPVGREATLREKAGAGFDVAVDDLIAQLDRALSQFQEQARSGTVRGPGTPAVEIVDASGQPAGSGTGAGAVGAIEVAVGAALAAAAWAGTRRRRRA